MNVARLWAVRRSTMSTAQMRERLLHGYLQMDYLRCKQRGWEEWVTNRVQFLLRKSWWHVTRWNLRWTKIRTSKDIRSASSLKRHSDYKVQLIHTLKNFIGADNSRTMLRWRADLSINLTSSAIRFWSARYDSMSYSWKCRCNDLERGTRSWLTSLYLPSKAGTGALEIVSGETGLGSACAQKKMKTAASMSWSTCANASWSTSRCGKTWRKILSRQRESHLTRGRRNKSDSGSRRVQVDTDTDGGLILVLGRAVGW